MLACWSYLLCGAGWSRSALHLRWFSKRLPDGLNRMRLLGPCCRSQHFEYRYDVRSGCPCSTSLWCSRLSWLCHLIPCKTDHSLCRSRPPILICHIEVIAYCDCVSVAQERLNLLSIVDVPNTHDAVFASRHYVLTIWRDSVTYNFIEVTFNLSIKFLSPKDELFLRLEIPWLNIIHSMYLQRMRQQSLDPVITLLLSSIHSKLVIACLWPFINVLSKASSPSTYSFWTESSIESFSNSVYPV